MKSALFVSLFAFTCLFQGCVSQGVSTNTGATIAAVIEPVAKNVVLLVLHKNPSYASAVNGFADALDAVVIGADFNPASEKALVDALALKYTISAEAKLYLASGLDDLMNLYKNTYGVTAVSSMDVNLKGYLTAFAQGLRDGVIFFKAQSA